MPPYTSANSIAKWTPNFRHVHTKTNGDLPELTTATFIGIMVAITGNILISLALNLQKLAHKRVEASKVQAVAKSNGHWAGSDAGHRRAAAPSLDETDEAHEGGNNDNINDTSPDATSPIQSHIGIPFPQSTNLPVDYGSRSDTHIPNPRMTSERRSFWSPLITGRDKMRKKPSIREALPEETSLLSVDVVAVGPITNERRIRKDSAGDDDVVHGNESDYLGSKMWWFGFCLMNLGELGNFISYAWAPASVVAPLGTFALMANCVFAPLMLGERFRKRDFLGILIAIIGAVTVVLASNASDTRLDPDALLLAISQPAFIIYSCIYVVAAVALATLSHGSIGRRWVFVDVGLCAIFGGFTVLSTKAISTLLTMQWIEMFTRWITYPILAVLILTGVGQIRYLNRALMRFDSKVVIPIQFVFFTLSAIIGSAILYGDFKKAKFHQVVTFLYGCAATFSGVFIIASPSSTPSETAPETGGAPEGPVSPETQAGHQILGALGQKRRPTLILPNGMPAVQRRQSLISLLGLSPAQPLLLVHTPPHELPPRLHALDHGRDTDTDIQTPDFRRRRAMSLFADDTRVSSPNGTRDGSVAERLQNAEGAPYDPRTRVGSLDWQNNDHHR